MQDKKFSYYDIEQFLRDAGAERINEKAIRSFEEELEETVKGLVGDAEVYAKYAGRKRLITDSDIGMAVSRKRRHVSVTKVRRKRAVRAKRPFSRPVLDATGMKVSAAVMERPAFR